MKKSALVLIMLLVFVVSANATMIGDETNNTAANENHQLVGQNNDQDVKQSANQDNKNMAVSGQDQDQKQAQGQAQGQAQKTLQGNQQNTAASNNTNTDSRYFSPATTPASTGTDNINASSPFFNAGISSTKKYVVLREQYMLIMQMIKDGYLTADQGKEESAKVLELMKAETRRKKILGFVPFTKGICDNSMLSTVPLVCF